MKLRRHHFVLAVAILVASFILFFVEEHVRGRWQLAAWKKQMAARGEKFDVEACTPPPPPAAENGFHELTAACSRLSNAQISQSAPPPWRMIAPGRALVSLSLTQWVRTDTRSRTNSTWSDLEQDLALYAEPMADARAALRKPVLDAALPYRLGFDLQLPHLARFKGLAQILAAQAAADLHHGRLEEAGQEIESLLALARGLRDERLIISQLVRHAIANIALGATWQALQAPGWNDTQLARLQKAWQSVDFMDPMIHALEMERAVGLVSYARLRASNADAVAMFGLSGGPPASAVPPTNALQAVDDLVRAFNDNDGEILFRNLFLPAWRVAWSHQDELHYLRLMQSLLETGRSAARERTGLDTVAVEKQLEARLERIGTADKMRRVASHLLFPGLSRTASKAALLEAQRELAIAAVALHRYEVRHGRAAPALDALVPDFVDAPPRDYFHGRPLQYRLVEDQAFLLYSVGRDGQDDGGDARPVEAGSRNYFLQNGRDLVWPQPATPEEMAAFEAAENKRTRFRR